MNFNAAVRKFTLVATVISSLFLTGVTFAADSIKGRVVCGGAPIAKSTVTLWEASTDAPKQLDQTKSSDDGRFEVRVKGAHGDGVLYLVAAGGVPKASKAGGDNPAVVLLSLLGSKPPEQVVVNELTTVASAFTAARFISGGAISGNALGLHIAAGNTPNLVNLQTGGWGPVIVDPGNSTWSMTLANFDTLGSLITAFATVANDDWRARFFTASTPTAGATPKNTLDAMGGIARTPWANPKALYALFDEAYPLPAPDERRAAPFLPYLVYAPPDFTLSLWFGGGGSYSNGNMVLDAEGNMWCGQNWLTGSQSGVNKSTGGNVVKFSTSGKALSPPITGFTATGVKDGIGWGTAVALDKVWIAGFKGPIAVMDFEGRPLAKETDFPFDNSKIGALMGVSVAANNDVWIAHSSKNQLVYFPGGRVKDGRIVKVAGLEAPFAIAIDAQNRVWVSNSQANTVIRFPAADPSKVDTFKVGIGARGVALDSKGNLWVTSLLSPDFPVPKMPQGLSIMQQFKILTDALMKNIEENKPTGTVNMISADGQTVSEGFTGGGTILAPWGIVVDGNDDVFAASFGGRGIDMLAGVGTNGHAPGTKPGDLIHYFQSGTLQMPTIGSVDPAGNLWVANNWNSIEAAGSPDPIQRTSTWGGGSGFTVFYGVAAPVKTPLLGTVRPY